MHTKFGDGDTSPREAAADALVCGTLAGDCPPAALPAADLAALWDRARIEDVDVIVADVLCRGTIAPELRQQGAARLAEAELRGLLRYRELCRLAAAFDAEQVDVLLLKGAGLAYTVYRAPHHRPSRDIDLFIRRRTRGAAERALAACGYRRMREPDGQVAHGQSHYVRADGNRLNHFVDLHWRVSNLHLFAGALPFESAWTASISVRDIEPPSRTLSLPDALLLACIHRVAHHHDAPDLLWLWDIHLIASSLTAEERDRFVSHAERTRVRAVAARGLELARERFGTPSAQEMLVSLTQAGPVEPTARFVGGGLRQLDRVRADLAATGRWADRATLVGEHLFPSPAYMREVYSRCPAGLLPLAYLDRIIRGMPKWFRRPPSAAGVGDGG